MDLITIAKLIYGRTQELERLKNNLEPLAKAKDEASAQYEKTLALIMIGLRNGKTYQFESETITEPPTTVIEKIAKGMCWKEKLAMDSAESAYKNTLKTIDLVESQMMGYQSINKYLNEVEHEKA